MKALYPQHINLTCFPLLMKLFYLIAKKNYITLKQFISFFFEKLEKNKALFLLIYINIAQKLVVLILSFRF